jgi:hypothetical protein
MLILLCFENAGINFLVRNNFAVLLCLTAVLTSKPTTFRTRNALRNTVRVRCSPRFTFFRFTLTRFTCASLYVTLIAHSGQLKLALVRSSLHFVFTLQVSLRFTFFASLNFRFTCSVPCSPWSVPCSPWSVPCSL